MNDQLPLSVYQDNGFSSREEYLDSLRDEYGVELVNNLITFMPPSEDFDGLVGDLQDMATGDYQMVAAELGMLWSNSGSL